MTLKKLLSTSLALALVYSISFPARAELLKNLKTDGSIEVRTFGIDNETDRQGLADDYRSETRTRLMIGGSFDLLDDVHARVQLAKNNRRYGDDGTGQGETGDDIQANIDVTNANVKIDKVAGKVDLTLGRQYYGNPNDLVIYYGPLNDDILGITSVDLMRADAGIMDMAKLTLIAGKTNEVGGPNVNGDTDLFGGEVNSDKVIPKGNLAAYYYTGKVKRASNGGFGHNVLNVYGLRAAGDILAGIGYNAEFAFNGGRDEESATSQPGYNGNAFILGLKAAKDVGLPVRVSAEWGQGTNDFNSIASDKRFGIIWGQHTSVATSPSNLGVDLNGAGLTNLKVFDASVGADITKKLGVDVAWYRFQKMDATLDPNIGSGGNRTSLATEYDLVLTWKHSDNVTLSASAATLQVGNAERPDGQNSPVTRLGGDIKIKF